jgi:hypothetical protein
MTRPDLHKIENDLYSLAVQCLTEFADAHADERFNAFGFDCNAEYGNVLLCFNTEEHATATASEYAEKYGYGPEEIGSLRRNFGDWKYQGFNLDLATWKPWREHEDAIEKYLNAGIEDDFDEAEDEDLIGALMACFCRTVVRIEKSGVLDRVQRTSGFIIQAVDHDESPEETDERLEQIRAELAI